MTYIKQRQNKKPDPGENLKGKGEKALDKVKHILRKEAQDREMMVIGHSGSTNCFFIGHLSFLA